MVVAAIIVIAMVGKKPLAITVIAIATVTVMEKMMRRAKWMGRINKFRNQKMNPHLCSMQKVLHRKKNRK